MNDRKEETHSALPHPAPALSLSLPALSYPRYKWRLALVGQFLFVFCIVTLSGPGRIDIDDGQSRFEVAQSLVDHGDLVIRDPDIWFFVLPGRNHQFYSTYRFPQTVLGVPALLIADATGPTLEARRHFFFALTSPFACAALALTYSLWFRFLGHSPFASLSWASAGIFCTPNWFYGTSTFDEMICSATLVPAVVIAFAARNRGSLLLTCLAGLFIGLAFNGKQPLGIFVLPVLAAAYNREQPLRSQLFRLALVFMGLALGILAYLAYDYWKFPPSTRAEHASYYARWLPWFPGNFLANLLSLAVSPGAGCFWYCPTLVLACYGLVAWFRNEKLWCWSLLAATGVFVAFISCTTFFKGDNAWGPRYHTPVFALFWLVVPAALGALRRRLVMGVLVLGLLVQLLALSVDQHRLYVERFMPSGFYYADPWIYFQPAYSNLPNRPREIVEILQSSRGAAREFTPARSPTYCLPIVQRMECKDQAAVASGLAAMAASPQTAAVLPAVFETTYPKVGVDTVRKFHILNSFRPWWISQQYLASDQRPVNLVSTFVLLAGGSVTGFLLMLISVRQIWHRNTKAPTADDRTDR